jgi:hypothetical protein
MKQSRFIEQIIVRRRTKMAANYSNFEFKEWANIHKMDIGKQ